MMRRQSGFTLIEVLLAVAVGAAAMVAVSGAFISTLQARNTIESISESTRAGQRILTLLERDLQGLWHYNIKGNKVFVGRNMDIGGYDADRIDFLTSSDSVTGARDTKDDLTRTSYCEVGYWLRENAAIPGLLELWRREDPLIDDNLLTNTEGTFQLVCDRLKDFNITYYSSIGHEAEEIFEWDSSREHMLPRRMKIEFTVHRKVANRNQVNQNEVDDFEQILKKYTRHIVLDDRYVDILRSGVAMIPVAPPPPEAEAGGGGGGAGGQGDGSGGGSSDAEAISRTEGAAIASGRGGPAGRANGGRGARGNQPGGGRGGGFGQGGGGGRGASTQTTGGGSSPAPGQIPFDLGDLLRSGGLSGSSGNPFGGLGGF